MYDKAHFTHLWQKRLQARPIFVKQYSQPYFRAESCDSSSSVFLHHYRTLRTKQRRRSKASGFRKQCREGSTTSSHGMAPPAQCCSSTRSIASCIFIFHETLILRLPEIRPIPWFLIQGEVEVRVDPSTWTNLNKVEPGTNDRDYLSSLIVLQSHIRILLFYKKSKNVSCGYDRWVVKLNFASCVIRQTRSLGVLVLCSNWNTVFANYICLLIISCNNEARERSDPFFPWFSKDKKAPS